jgi:hypothetical protein
MGQRIGAANKSHFSTSANFYPEDGVSMFSWNVDSHKPDFTVP